MNSALRSPLTAEHRLSRRLFLATSAAAALAGERPVFAAPTTRPKHKYIDIHTHLGAFHAGQTVSVKGLLDWMDEHDVERAVILPLVSPEAAPRLQAMQTSDAAIEAAQAHPDRLIAFCCLDPRVTTTNPAAYGHVEGRARDDRNLAAL